MSCSLTQLLKQPESRPWFSGARPNSAATYWATRFPHGALASLLQKAMGHFWTTTGFTFGSTSTTQNDLFGFDSKAAVHRRCCFRCPALSERRELTGLKRGVFG